MGRDGTETHTVIAPFFWDFASPSSRSTVAFPVFWRFADDKDGDVHGHTLLPGRWSPWPLTGRWLGASFAR